jgi:aklavinone 12-hydroxylase
VWQADPDGQRMSTLDLFGDGWVLITGGSAEAWRAAARRLAANGGVRLTTHTAQSDELVSAYGISHDGASLVRPDGVVAWRAATGREDAEASLRAALDRVLFR